MEKRFVSVPRTAVCIECEKEVLTFVVCPDDEFVCNSCHDIQRCFERHTLDFLRNGSDDSDD